MPVIGRALTVPEPCATLWLEGSSDATPPVFGRVEKSGEAETSCDGDVASAPSDFEPRLPLRRAGLFVVVLRGFGRVDVPVLA